MSYYFFYIKLKNVFNSKNAKRIITSYVFLHSLVSQTFMLWQISPSIFLYIFQRINTHVRHTNCGGEQAHAFPSVEYLAKLKIVFYCH